MVKRECFWCYRRRPVRVLVGIVVADPLLDGQKKCRNNDACMRAMQRRWKRQQRERRSLVVDRYGRWAMSCWRDLVELHSTAVST